MKIKWYLVLQTAALKTSQSCIRVDTLTSQENKDMPGATVNCAFFM